MEALTHVWYWDHARGRRSWLAAVVADQVDLLEALSVSRLGALYNELHATHPCGCSPSRLGDPLLQVGVLVAP